MSGLYTQSTRLNVQVVGVYMRGKLLISTAGVNVMKWVVTTRMDRVDPQGCLRAVDEVKC